LLSACIDREHGYFPQAHQDPLAAAVRAGNQRLNKGDIVVVTNMQRSTAIVIRNDGHKVTLVPMKSGKLSARTLSFAEFRGEWQETGYALSLALTTFLSHIMKWGASLEAARGLEKLAARDRFVIASLF
jgi:hypothetical protein